MKGSKLQDMVYTNAQRNKYAGSAADRDYRIMVINSIVAVESVQVWPTRDVALDPIVRCASNLSITEERHNPNSFSGLLTREMITFQMSSISHFNSLCSSISIKLPSSPRSISKACQVCAIIHSPHVESKTVSMVVHPRRVTQKETPIFILLWLMHAFKSKRKRDVKKFPDRQGTLRKSRVDIRISPRGGSGPQHNML